MSRMICVSTPRVKPARRRPADPHPFGAGILPYHPSAGRVPYTIEDLDAAAQMFANAENDRENRRLEQRAGEAVWEGQFHATAPAGCCQLCGEPSDWLDPVHGLCEPCMTAAENATIASVNAAHGLGRRVF